jgi:hypothetical protein
MVRLEAIYVAMFAKKKTVEEMYVPLHPVLAWCGRHHHRQTRVSKPPKSSGRGIKSGLVGYVDISAKITEGLLVEFGLKRRKTHSRTID